MKMLSITLKDLQILLKEPGAIVQMVLLPFIFIIIFTLAVGGPSEDAALELPVVNLDQGGEKAEELLAEIRTSGGVEIVLYDQEQAQAEISERGVDHLLTIPAGFTQQVELGQQIALALTISPQASDAETSAITLVVEGAARSLSLKHNLVASLQQIGEMQATNPPEYQVFTAERNIAQAESQFIQSRSRPLVSIQQTWPAVLGERDTFNPVQVSVPGFTILFVFLTAQTTATSIYTEKKLGSFRRLMAAPLSKAALLVGKLLPNFIMVILQMTIIFTISVFVLPLLGADRLNLGEDPLALILLSLLIALCSTSLGILIAALARTEAQIGGISAVILWLMGGVGGTFFPTFFLSGFLGTIGKIVPHYWANKAFNDLLVRGVGLSGLGTPMLMLVGFTIVFFIIGLWRFDFD